MVSGAAGGLYVAAGTAQRTGVTMEWLGRTGVTHSYKGSSTALLPRS